MEFIADGKEQMPREERQRYLNEGLVKFVQEACQTVPAVKEKLDQAGVAPAEIRTIADLQRVPITRKDDFAQIQRANPPFGGFLTTPLNKLKRISIAPGPTYVPGLDFSEYVRMIHILGFAAGDVVSITFNYNLGPGAITMDEAFRALGATVINTGVGNTELQMQIMAELGVTGYMGTPSFLMTLIQTAERLGYDFRRDFRLKRTLFGGEPLPRSMRKTMEDDYGIDTNEFYGLVETGPIGYSCSAKSGMHFAENMIVELVDPDTGRQVEPGQTAEVVVTPLNGPFPLLRYGTGDLSAYTEEPCSCGQTSSKLLWVMGRIGDAVKVRGMYVHAHQVDRLISTFSALSKAQIVVNRIGVRDELTLKVELKDEGADRGKLLTELEKSFPDVCRVRADKIEFLAKGTTPEEYKKVVDQRTWE